MSLTVRNLGVRKSGRWIISGINLELAPGRLCVLLGGNGAGKTTLLQALSGDLAADSGTVTLDQRLLADWRAVALAQRRAVLTQHDNLRFPFRVSEVVALSHLPWSGTTRRAHTDEIDRAALRAAHADAFVHRIYTELSGGERARVRFAQVLAQVWDQPGAFLLLDEPLAHLDFAYRQRCLEEARRQARRGLGVIAVLHDPNLAVRYADDVVLLQEGHLIGCGPAADWLTAGRLSQIYDCTVTRVDDGTGSAFFQAQP